MGTFVDKYFKGDRAIWLVVILLSAFSLLVVYSSTGSLAFRYHGGNTTYFLVKQLVFLVLALSIVFVTHLISYRVYYPLSSLLMLISIPLLLFTLVFGTRLNEASRWLEIPGLGITFQSSDVAKFALVMYMAKILSQKQKDIKDLKQGFLPLALPVILICGLILPANFSTAALLGLTCWIMMYVGRVNLKYLLGFTGIGVALFAIFVVVALHFGITPTVTTRLSNRKLPLPTAVSPVKGRAGQPREISYPIRTPILYTPSSLRSMDFLLGCSSSVYT